MNFFRFSFCCTTCGTILLSFFYFAGLILIRAAHNSILGLLIHENSDIAADVIDLIKELTDTDVAEENHAAVKLLVETLVCLFFPSSSNHSSWRIKFQSYSYPIFNDLMKETRTKGKGFTISWVFLRISSYELPKLSTTNVSRMSSPS